jgi:F420-non-reducing hydrogenase iron-sulfur subunit
MTIKRMRFMQELLKFMGLEGRLHLEWISSAEAQKFIQVVTEFTEKIIRLGPSPLSGKNIHTFGDKPKARKAEPIGIQGGQNASAG